MKFILDTQAKSVTIIGTITFDELAEKMNDALQDIPGVTFGFQYPIQMRFNELMTGARQDVVCKIFGENLDTLAYYAKKLGGISTTVKGSTDLYVEAVTGMPQIVIQYDRAAIAQYGVNISEINKVVNAAFAGQSSGLVYEGERRFDLVVRLAVGQRRDLRDVQNLLIPVSQRTQIPLNQVAKVEVQEGPNQIQREDAQRRIIVGFNVRGRDVQSIVKELQQKAEQQIKLPPGYYITYGGAFENLEAAKKRLFVAVPVALVLIFLMLYFAFNSIKQGLLIYSAIPLSALGGVFALAIRGMPFSISAGVGFIALFGVSVLNGIVLIAEFNRLKKEGHTDLKRIVIQGTKVRLRPVLMTALVASLGFLPMALSNGAGAEVQRPLATVVIGGLLIATLLTLFVLPVLYIIFEKGIFMRKKTVIAKIILLTGISISLCFNKAGAQVPITLQAATDSSLKNNLSLRSERLNADYLQKLKDIAYTLPPTNATVEYGQINSAYSDNQLSISQSMKFPAVYARQKSVYDKEWKSGVLNIAVKENELRKQVANVYYEMLYLQQKKKLLEHTDSLFTAFLKITELRLKVGETNILEKTTAETQQGHINIQLQELQEDFNILQSKFKWLLNTRSDVVPTESSFKMAAISIADTSVLQQHPGIRQLQQQQQINMAKLALERSKLLPDLFINYNNATLKGEGSDGEIYSGTRRFHSVQAGIGIPLFRRGQKASIAAGKINVQLAENNYAQGLQLLLANYQQTIDQYNKNLRTVNYFETVALKNADIIIQTADIQFKNGEINYLDWVILTNNAVGIQSQYIDAVRNLNQSIIELNSFITQ